VELVAVCDNNEKRLGRVADKFNIKKRYSNLSDMLQSNEFDIIDITTPGFTHYNLAKEALKSNVHVLVEKPVTLDTSEAEDLMLESDNRNLKLGVCQAFRYSEPVIEFQNVRRNGGIGHIDRIITIQHGSSIFALPSWFWDENLSRGILYELAIHAIDLQCYLMGPSKGVLDININYDKALNFTTSILLTIQFESGLGVVDLKWLSSSSFLHLYISGSVADAIIKFYPDSFVLQRGDFAPVSECKAELKRLWDFGQSAFRRKYYKKSEAPHRIMIENFIQSVKTDRQPYVPIADVIPTHRLLDEIWLKSRVLVNEQKKIN
jgi:predicted dehydrogenase